MKGIALAGGTGTENPNLASMTASQRRLAIASFTDDSIANLSSIVALAEQNGKRRLLTGDARGDKILQGLTAADLLTNGKIHVDILKVPHDGSDRNVSTDFFRKVAAKHYVFSGDGSHGNPDRATLAMLTEARGGASYTMWFTFKLNPLSAASYGPLGLLRHQPTNVYRLSIPGGTSSCRGNHEGMLQSLLFIVTRGEHFSRSRVAFGGYGATRSQLRFAVSQYTRIKSASVVRKSWGTAQQSKTAPVTQTSPKPVRLNPGQVWAGFSLRTMEKAAPIRYNRCESYESCDSWTPILLGFSRCS